MKYCNKCLTSKEETEFYKDKRSKDGLEYCCKICKRDKDSRYVEVKQTYGQQYYLDNKEHHAQYSKQYYIENKEKVDSYHNEYEKKRKAVDPLYKLIKRARTLIHDSLVLKNFTKNSQTHKLLGCSYEEFAQHLGPEPDYKCHLDHICPCAQAKTQEEAEKLCHYSNIRWLMVDDNLQKSDNWTPEGEELCKQLLNRRWIY